MLYTKCPACRDSISLIEKLQVGQNIVCPKCSELLIVNSLDPFVLDLYAFSASSAWGNADKEEAAKKHQRRNKHRQEDYFDFENEADWKKTNKKSRSRMHEDW
jgi:DNA-directed RNA polymerase subunit RPC12/RpoP